MKEKAFFYKKNGQLQEYLSKIDNKMTKIKSMGEKIMLFEKTVDDNIPEIIKSSINIFTPVYYSAS